MQLEKEKKVDPHPPLRPPLARNLLNPDRMLDKNFIYTINEPILKYGF